MGKTYKVAPPLTLLCFATRRSSAGGPPDIGVTYSWEYRLKGITSGIIGIARISVIPCYTILWDKPMNVYQITCP